jgi:hypothetical protein
MPVAIPVNLSIPADGPLGPALLAAQQQRQKSENTTAKREKREARDITIQETILSICAESLSVDFSPPKRGRPWPSKPANPN